MRVGPVAAQKLVDAGRLDLLVSCRMQAELEIDPRSERPALPRTQELHLTSRNLPAAAWEALRGANWPQLRKLSLHERLGTFGRCALTLK